jgi:DNA helicase HerA-like ATPase
LPEAGDLPQPKLCFFFDEAHLLFDDAPPALTEKVEQVVRLIRSKGVGVYFITQNPIDIPEKIAGQLGNRVQHALRAFTPRDQAAVKSAAETFRANPEINVASAITELRVGEALVSLLQPDGSPSPVQRTLIRPPSSRVGPLSAEERGLFLTTDEIGSKYDERIDRESAEELVSARVSAATEAAADAKRAREEAKQDAAQAKADAAAERERAKLVREEERLEAQRRRQQEQADARAAREAARPTMTDKLVTSATRAAASTVGRQIGNQILRGLLGGLLRGRR